MQNEKVTQHRLGIARSTLKRISSFRSDAVFPWDYMDIANYLQTMADDALREMGSETDKKRKRREHDRDVWVARLAEEVKEEVPE